VQAAIASREDVVEHGLELVLVDVGYIYLAIADLLHEAPVEVGEAEAGVLHVLALHRVHHLAQVQLVLLVQQVARRLVQLHLPRQPLLRFMQIVGFPLKEVRRVLEALLQVDVREERDLIVLLDLKVLQEVHDLFYALKVHYSQPFVVTHPVRAQAIW